MYQLSIADVAGLIAAAVAIFQFVLPNALIVILVAVIRDTHSAVTWSVVGNALANSYWPTVLRSDTTFSTNVHIAVRWTTWIRPLGLALFGIASIVTPLGLYESVESDDKPRSVSFDYVADTGPMGYGTPARSTYRFTRDCEYPGAYLINVPIQCPGTNTVANISQSADWLNDTWDDYEPRVPPVLVDLYQSGLNDQPQTISSFFDIQSRTYTYFSQKGELHDHKILVGAYRSLTSLILDDAIEAIEGLVVDLVNGGVGFRNHTVPQNLAYGAEWWEDLLFLEPETACVDTNTTVEFVIPNHLDPMGNFTIVDHGGFINFDKEYRLQRFWEMNTQKDARTEARAYEAAWMFNAFNMLYLNITRPNPDAFAYIDSQLGQGFPIASFFDSYVVDEHFITTDFEAIIQPPQTWVNGSIINGSDFDKIKYPNPWNITDANYSSITEFCQSSLWGDFVNLTNINSQCGIALGAARRLDGSQSLIAEPGVRMIRPLYSCASTTKALIKSVHFRYNTSKNDGLKGLEILDVSKKVYQNESEKPLWGVETLDPDLYHLGGIAPLWGLISDSHQSAVNLSTVRSERLYLPCYYWSFYGASSGVDYMPGTEYPANAWQGVYSTFSTAGSGPDYTGANSLAMFVKWQDLSRNASSTSRIMNLIWTDIMANMVVGTRSWLSGDRHPWDKKAVSKRDGVSSLPNIEVPVYVYNRRIRYHWLFAIPAFMCLVLCGVVILTASAFSIKGRGTIGKIRHYMWHLSSGRLLGTLLYPEESDIRSKTSQWIKTVGRKDVTILSDDPHGFAASEATQSYQEKKTKSASETSSDDFENQPLYQGATNDDNGTITVSNPIPQNEQTLKHASEEVTEVQPQISPE